MRQFATIAINAFMELVRQPVFLLLTTVSAAFEIFLATPYYFAFGDEPKLVKNSTLAVMLLAGLFWGGPPPPRSFSPPLPPSSPRGARSTPPRAGARPFAAHTVLWRGPHPLT